MGSYDANIIQPVYKKTIERPRSAYIGKSKDSEGANKVNKGDDFTSLTIKQKRGVPAVGQYDPIKCYNHISRPMRKR